MAYVAKIVEDSVNEFDQRLVTMEWTYPRFIHAEILTHRDRERNSASSRAIPWPRMRERITNDPVIPIRFGSEQKGMQTGAEIDNPNKAERIWLEARDNALKSAQDLADLGVHKSICNRFTEPFMWITVIMTATEWKNLFRLRCHPDAEIHFQRIAELARATLESNSPTHLSFGNWHLPYVTYDERQCIDLETLRKASVARCARVSYLTHDGSPNLDNDVKLFERLVQGSGFGHWSPHGHIAMSASPDVRSGPFRGWLQYRKLMKNECADS